MSKLVGDDESLVGVLIPCPNLVLRLLLFPTGKLVCHCAGQRNRAAGVFRFGCTEYDSTAIYVFINAWNEYLYSMILMSSSDKTTISVAVKTLEGADILNWGSLMAACAIVVVPSIIFFCFIQN